MNKMKHWYGLVYEGLNIETEAPSKSTIYLGFNQQRVTFPLIDLHMKTAKIKNGILINCFYIGFMTQYEFENNVPPSGNDGDGIPVFSIASVA